jgi:hypothetical protein
MYVAAACSRGIAQTGSRHQPMLAGRARGGESLPEAAKMFCRALYRAVPTHDPSALNRRDAEVEDTYRRGGEALERGDEAMITAQRTLSKIVGDLVAVPAIIACCSPRPAPWRGRRVVHGASTADAVRYHIAGKRIHR